MHPKLLPLSLQAIRSARVDEETLVAKSERAERVIPEAQYLEKRSSHASKKKNGSIGELSEIATPSWVIARQRRNRLEERLLTRLDPDPRGDPGGFRLDGTPWRTERLQGSQRATAFFRRRPSAVRWSCEARCAETESVLAMQRSGCAC